MKRAADTLILTKEDQRIELCDECKTEVLKILHSPDEIIGFDRMPGLIMTLSDEITELQEKLAIMETKPETNFGTSGKKKRGRPRKSNSQSTH